MLERLKDRIGALAERRAEVRRRRLADEMRAEAPAGVRVHEEERAVVLSGRGLKRRFALDPELRWLVAGRKP